MSEEQKVIEYFKTAISHYARENCAVNDWLTSYADNSIKLIEVEHAIEYTLKGHQEVEIVHRDYNAERFHIVLRIHNAENWREVRRYVNQVIAEVSEQFLLKQEVIDDKFYNIWFVTGTLTGPAVHGHVGIISLEVKYIRHLNDLLFPE